MIRWRRSILCLAGGSLLAPTAVTQSEPQDSERTEQVDSRQSFSGETRLLSGEALVVDIRSWTIGGGTRIESMPFERDSDDLLIVRLRGGSLTTLIDGTRELRRENEFWTVPPGTRMGVETHDDSAIIETIVVRQAR